MGSSDSGKPERERRLQNLNGGSGRPEDLIEEDDGTLVHRTTLPDIYRRLVSIERNQNTLCEKLDEYNGLREELSQHRDDFSRHLQFCTSFRGDKEHLSAVDEGYAKGYSAAIEEAEVLSERRFMRLKAILKLAATAVALATGAIALATWFMNLWNW